jgi:hypothetical protein
MLQNARLSQHKQKKTKEVELAPSAHSGKPRLPRMSEDMANRKLELTALALLADYFVLFYFTRTPVCEIGHVSRASISCRPPPPPPKLEPGPGGGFVVMLGKPRRAG